MPRYSTEAIVLRSINYKDSDKILTLFSRDRGKITASARGVRKISSRRGGNLDTLNYVVLGISEGQNKKYKIITEASTKNSFKNLKNSLENSVKGFYIAELVDKMLEEGQVNKSVFDLLVSSLKKLDVHLNNEKSRVNAFEIALLKYLGYEMYLDRCARTERLYDDTWEVIKFNPNFGGFVSDANFPGFELEKPTADLLYSLKTKKKIPKALLENENAVKEADRIIKMFIKEVLEEGFRTERIFGEI